jgi:hypothetical protein
MGYTVPPEGYWKSFARKEACDRHYPKPDPLCVACGDPDAVTVTPSTMRIAMAIAEYALGRRHGEGRGRRGQ